MKTYEILIRDTAAEARAQAREARRKARERTANIQHGLLALGIVALAVIIVTASGCGIRADSTADTPPVQAQATAERIPASTPEPTPEPTTRPEINDMPGPLLETAPVLWATEGGAPLDRETVVEALLAHAYLSDAVPMAYEYQDYMRTYCAAYGCPYPLALAVAETESGFDMDAIGEYGEIGIMQLNPGPDGSYLAEIEAATGIDPTTPEGNIAGGCHKLGKFLERYGDPATAVMAYRMGQAGADKALEAGADPMDWAGKYMEALERWECTVNAWRGQ